MNLYYQNELKNVENGAALELRAQLAWELLRTNGILMARPAGEDSTGRQALEVMPAKELADRALSIAEAFVAACEERNYLAVVTMTQEQAAAEAGRLQKIRDNAVWGRDEKKAA